MFKLKHFAGYFIGLVAMVLAAIILAYQSSTIVVETIKTSSKASVKVNVEKFDSALMHAETLWGVFVPLLLAVAVALIWWVARKATKTWEKVAAIIAGGFVAVLFTLWVQSTNMLGGTAFQYSWRGFMASACLICGAGLSWLYYRHIDTQVVVVDTDADVQSDEEVDSTRPVAVVS